MTWLTANDVNGRNRPQRHPSSHQITPNKAFNSDRRRPAAAWWQVDSLISCLLARWDDVSQHVSPHASANLVTASVCPHGTTALYLDFFFFASCGITTMQKVMGGLVTMAQANVGRKVSGSMCHYSNEFTCNNIWGQRINWSVCLKSQYSTVLRFTAHVFHLQLI